MKTLQLTDYRVEVLKEALNVSGMAFACGYDGGDEDPRVTEIGRIYKELGGTNEEEIDQLSRYFKSDELGRVLEKFSDIREDYLLEEEEESALVVVTDDDLRNGLRNILKEMNKRGIAPTT